MGAASRFGPPAGRITWHAPCLAAGCVQIESTLARIPLFRRMILSESLQNSGSCSGICNTLSANFRSPSNRHASAKHDGVIMARHRLMKAGLALREKGAIPPGVDTEHQKVRSVATLLQREVLFNRRRTTEDR